MIVYVFIFCYVKEDVSSGCVSPAFPSFFFRLYGCLRLACGWILWNIRFVDDGLFRRRVCEALFFCYLLQGLAVLRAQLTDTSRSNINWIAILIMTVLGGAYAAFRFGKGGNRIKVYELPSSGNLV